MKESMRKGVASGVRAALWGAGATGLLGAGTGPAAASDLPSGTLLAFDPGVEDCAIGGTPPDCEFGVITVVDGSYFAMDTNGDLNFSGSERVAISPGPDGGVIVGQLQDASGSHSGFPDGTEDPTIDQPWAFFANTGMHQTTAVPPTETTDPLGQRALDFAGWGVTWNGIPNIPMGGDAANFGTTDMDGDGRSDGAGDMNTGLALVRCYASESDADSGIETASCASGDFFMLDYTARVPQGDPSGFGGVAYQLHLEGTLSEAGARVSIVVPDGLEQECAQTGGTEVTLDTEISIPADDAVSSLSWTVDGEPAGQGETIDAFLALNGHTVSVTLNTVLGDTADDQESVTIVDTVPPEVNVALVDRKTGAPVDQIDGNLTRAQVQATATDVCDADPTVNATLGMSVDDGTPVDLQTDADWLKTGAPGAVEVNATATDESGNSAQASDSVNVVQ